MTLARSVYTDTSQFEQEMAGCFSKRLFIGTQQDFASINDYRSLQIGNVAFSCRQTPFGIRAFNNVCLHRNCLIDPPGTGNRNFQCGYHGWRYGDSGELLHAPLCTMGSISNQQLPSFPVASSAPFHFISLADKTPPELAEVPALLIETGLQPVGKPFYENALLHHCNWKLLVENVLESLHITSIHQTTFVQAGIDSQTRGTWGSGGDYTSWGKLHPQITDSNPNSYLPSTGQQHYSHGFIFPNLLFSNTNNLVAYISHLLPVDATHTWLYWQLYEQPEMQQLPPTQRKLAQQYFSNFSQKVLDEDKLIVERCQQGLGSHGPDIQLQLPRDVRVADFHRMLSLALNKQASP